ncbi:MAG: helix-turn-helix transcriptional regulator [Anaerolineales bacterium]|nr:helix-turn-helix transcriptional regulator [Anaerolineales bacterium]
MSDVQLILKDGQPEYAVLPYDLYIQLVEDAEMLQDIRDYDDAMRRIAAGEEVVPAELVYAMVDGAHPVKVWREYRGLTQRQLAAQAGISPAYLSQIEAGKRTGSTEVLQAIARALNLALDDIV